MNVGLSAEVSGKTKALSHAEMVEQATSESADAHRISVNPDGSVLIPAPMQDVAARLTPAGATFYSESDAEGRGEFALLPQSIGREQGSSTGVPSGQVAADENIARIYHPNLIQEFTTSSEGIRQDFLLPQRPAGNGELLLQLNVEGATVRAADRGVALTLNGGRELAYHGLKVFDRNDRELPARFVVAGEHTLQIQVDDRGAAYPVRIDPTITDADWFSLGAAPSSPTFYVHGLVSDGAGNLYVGGQFNEIPGVEGTAYIAKWDGSSWSALGSGVNSTVLALAWDANTNTLYAGGGFYLAGDSSAWRVAAWDGSSWSALDSGLNNTVNALAWDASTNTLYAGGAFTTAGGTSANHIAAWDGSSWSALGSGMDNNVFALDWDATSSTLYAGGAFTTAGGTSANHIAAWDGSNWSALGAGMNNYVGALAWDATNNTLYAGGSFTSAGANSTNNIAAWNGSNWSALGTGVNSIVKALAWDATNSTLYAGGYFTTAGGNSASRIAAWDGSNWSALGLGVGSGGMEARSVNALAWDATTNTLYAGGNFTTVGGSGANYIAAWANDSWSPLGAVRSGLNAYVSDLVWDGDNGILYAGGGFTTVGGNDVNRVAAWNGSSWSPLGAGVNGRVNALAWDATTGTLYAGGDFYMAGSGVASRVAAWDGSNWSALGSGLDRNVYALAWDATSNTLYAGGWFTTAGGNGANYIAAWDGSNWSALGSGLDNSVLALAWDATTGTLYAGGYFSTAGGNSANQIAAWNGSNWSALGSGLNSTVNALVWDATSSTLYAGGGFTTAGSTSANHIAAWDGSNWSALGAGLNNTVNALAWDATTSSLYAGGYFTAAGGNSANRIAAWDGSNWSALGSGMNNTIQALAWDATNSTLYAGGNFTVAGAADTGYVARGVVVNHTPQLGGFSAGQTVNDTSMLSPFALVTIEDVDGDNLTTTITLDSADKGGFTTESLAASGFSDDGGGSYSLNIVDAQAAIRLLVFDPAENRVAPGSTETTAFTVEVTDGLETVSDSTTSVVSTSINDAPTFTGTPAITGVAVVGDTLSVADAEATDPDVTDAVTLSYQWRADGVAIDGDTGSSYLLTSAELNKEVTVDVTASDEFGGRTRAHPAGVHVYEELTLTDSDGTTLPLLIEVASGDTAVFSLGGGEGSAYTVSAVKANGHGDNGPAGTVVDLGGGDYEFVPPTTGAFAGDYVVTVTDDATGATASFTVTVPLAVEATRTQLLGGVETGELTVTGAQAGTVFNFLVKLPSSDGSEPVIDDGSVATVESSATAATDDANANPATVTFTPAAVIDHSAFFITASDGMESATSATLTAQAPMTYAGAVYGPAGEAVSGQVTLYTSDGADGTVTVTNELGAPWQAQSDAAGHFSLVAPKPVDTTDATARTLQIVADGFSAGSVSAGACLESAPCTVMLDYETTAAEPVLTPAGGTFTGSVDVTLTTTTVGATLYYTLDGMMPDRATGTAIASGETVSLTQSATLKVLATKDQLNDSPVVSADYVIEAAEVPSGSGGGGGALGGWLMMVLGLGLWRRLAARPTAIRTM